MNDVLAAAIPVENPRHDGPEMSSAATDTQSLGGADGRDLIVLDGLSPTNSASTGGGSSEVDGALVGQPSADSQPHDSLEAPSLVEPLTGEEALAKKVRAPRQPKPVPAKGADGSVATIVDRVVKLAALAPEELTALGRVLAVALSDDPVTRLSRVATVSLGPAGASGAEALATVVGLSAANPMHVGVQLGRLSPAMLPDVYRCATALTGAPANPLPRGDAAVFAVADALGTMTPEQFNLAKALAAALT